MKRLTVAFLGVVTGFSGGCAIPDKPSQQPPSTTATASPTSPVNLASPLETEVAKTKPRFNLMQTSQQLSQNAAALNGEQPFAVIKVDPQTGKLSGEMELRLKKVIEEAKKDERILIRLESFVPDGGSPGLDLSKSEKTLQIVKDHLVRSGISHRRILVSSFGAEHDIQRDPTRHWVEINLIRNGTTLAPASTGTSK